MAKKKAPLLFGNYSNIFKKLLNNEIDLNILERFLVILKKIEENEIDQHEGSYMVGSLLKQIFIDKKPIKKIKKKREKAITWEEYKHHNKIDLKR